MKTLLARLFCSQRPISWRRLLAFMVATALLVGGYIDQDAWMFVAIAYIGGELAQRLVGPAAPPAQASPPPV